MYLILHYKYAWDFACRLFKTICIDLDEIPTIFETPSRKKCSLFSLTNLLRLSSYKLCRTFSTRPQADPLRIAAPANARLIVARFIVWPCQRLVETTFPFGMQNGTIFCRFIVDSLPMGLNLEVVDAIASEFSPWTGFVWNFTRCIFGLVQDQLHIAGVSLVRIIFPRSCGWQPWGDLVTSPHTRICLDAAKFVVLLF